MERRLSAIFAADVVGFSRLMETDEAGTFERLRTLRTQLFEPEITGHHGRIFKLMGDGLLAEFGSVVDAVECAVQLQRKLAEHNEGLPDDQKIVVRIGINLGDVIVEGEDRHGDGVNIAARLEGLAEPGGIILSGTAYDQLKKKVNVGFEFLGEQQVKNIAEPVRIYRLLTDPAAVGKTIGRKWNARNWKWPATLAAAFLFVLVAGAVAWLRPWEPAFKPEIPLPDKPSIAVMPFDSLSEDKEQAYLADGITEDLTTDLAQIPGLFVISRTAAFSYKGKDVQPRQIAAELGVRYLLEGSIRRAGEALRINAQLIDATTSGHLWADRFEGAWADVFSLQDKMVASVVQVLRLRLTAPEANGSGPGGTSNVEAYEAYRKGWELVLHETPTDLAKGVELLKRAVELDPNYGQAYAAMASAYFSAWGAGGYAQALRMSEVEVARRMMENLEKALERPTPEAHRVQAYVLLTQHRFEDAIAALERAVALNPSDADTYAREGEILILSGRVPDGRKYIETAFRLDPRSIRWRYFFEALIAFSNDDFEGAVASLAKDDNLDFYDLTLAASAYGYLGRAQEAAETLAKLDIYLAKSRYPEMTLLLARDLWHFKHETDEKRLLNGLHKAGVPELPTRFDPQSKERLNTEELKTLVLGNELRGRRLGGGPWFRKTSPDGSETTYSLEGLTETGFVVNFDDNVFCSWFPIIGISCIAVFRNPDGTASEQNEYIAVRPYFQFDFSIVK